VLVLTAVSPQIDVFPRTSGPVRIRVRNSPAPFAGSIVHSDEPGRGAPLVAAEALSLNGR